MISRTLGGTGCPVCAGKVVVPGENDLASLFPEIAAQWHPTLNGDLTPDQVTVGSRHRIWWICPEGHVWRAAVYSRTGKLRCGRLRVYTVPCRQNTRLEEIHI